MREYIDNDNEDVQDVVDYEIIIQLLRDVAERLDDLSETVDNLKQKFEPY